MAVQSATSIAELESPLGSVFEPWYKDPQYLAGGIMPSMIFQPTLNRYAKASSPNGPLRPVTLMGLLEGFTRSGDFATLVNAAGVTKTVGANVPRITHDPATLQPLGLLVEESRTNYIRNNTNSGAVEGSSGSLPSRWTNTLRGLSRNIRLGTERGIPVIYIRFTGTPTSTGEVNVIFEPTANTAATNSQAWSMSAFVARTAGSFTNVTSPRLQLNVFSDPSTYLSTIISQSLSAVTSSLTRYGTTGTTPTASSAYVQPLFAVNVTSGQAVDFEIAFGLPQNETGSTISSPIPTSGTTVTRAGDFALTTDIAPINPTEGTFIVEARIQGNSKSFQTAVALSSNSVENGMYLRVRGDNGNLEWNVTDTGAVQAPLVVSSTPVANTTFKTALAYAANDFAASYNGNSAVTNTSGNMPVGLDRITVGCSSGAQPRQWNGNILQVLYYPKRLTDAEIQRLTTL